MSPDDTNVNPTQSDPTATGGVVVPGGETMSTEEANAVDAAMAEMPAIPGEEISAGAASVVEIVTPTTEPVVAETEASSAPESLPETPVVEPTMGATPEATSSETTAEMPHAPEIGAIETPPSTEEIVAPGMTGTEATPAAPITAAGMGGTTGAGVADFTKEGADVVAPALAGAATPAKGPSKKTMIILIAVVGVLVIGAVAILLLTM